MLTEGQIFSDSWSEGIILKENIYPAPLKRTIDTYAYLSMLRELVENGERLSIRVVGMSMFPFLEHKRDSVFFEAPKRELKKGEIVFYQRRNGQFVMHRICAVKDEGYYMAGDAQNVVEGPVMRNQVFAVITQVQRNGKMLDASNLVWKFYEKMWVNVIPFRKYLLIPYRLNRLAKRLL